MGMFDSVCFRCPKCSGKIEVQSKEGDCNLIEFDEYEVPSKIALDIVGKTAWCSTCKKAFKVARAPIPKTVPMRLEEKSETDE